MLQTPGQDDPGECIPRLLQGEATAQPASAATWGPHVVFPVCLFPEEPHTPGEATGNPGRNHVGTWLGGQFVLRAQDGASWVVREDFLEEVPLALALPHPWPL